MSIYRGPYFSATGCTGSARPGARALQSWYTGAYGAMGAANLGIYACKSLGSGWSIHAEGRAADLGTAPYNNPSGSGSGRWPDWGWDLMNALRLNSAELGIQLIIFRRKIWSCTQPDAGWRDYTGSNPHDGHGHVELIPTAAANLTAARIEEVIGGGSKPTPPPATPRPPATDWRKELVSRMNTVNLSGVRASASTHVKGANVRRLQSLLAAAGYPPARTFDAQGRPDGIGGPGTREALGRFQQAQRTGRPSSPGTPDYVAGAATWSKLLGV